MLYYVLCITFYAVGVDSMMYNALRFTFYVLRFIS